MKKALFILVFIFGFFTSAFADTPTESDFTITTGGFITAVCPDTYIYGTVGYFGTYPTFTAFDATPQFSYCDILFGGNYTIENFLDTAYAGNDGDYWVRFTTFGTPYTPDYSGIWYYWRATRIGGLWYEYNASTTASLFTSFVVSTTTQTVNITGYWNATTTPNITEYIEFFQTSTLLGQESYITLTATTTGLFNLTFPYKILPTPFTGATTTATLTADTVFFSNLYQNDNNYPSNPFIGLIDPRQKTLLAATSSILAASTTDLYNLASSTALFNYPEYECSITSLTGCFKNSLIWAFYPTPDTMNKYINLLTLIQTKPPIGYFTIVKESLNSLSLSGISSFYITLPKSIKDYLFTPFDVGIASILWFYFIINFYKRLKHITI